MNDINFENMSNDDAVRVLRDVVQKPGPIKVSVDLAIHHFLLISIIFVTVGGGQVLGPQS